MSLSTRWSALLLLAHICIPTMTRAVHAAEPEKLPWKPEKIVATAKLSEHSHMLVVPVVVTGREYWFVIDTEQYRCTIDRSLLEGQRPLTFRQLGYTQDYLERKGSKAHVSDDAGATTPPDLRIGLYQPKVKAVWSSDAINDAKEHGLKLHGVLGMEVLQHLVLHIDPENDILHLSEPDTNNPPPGKSTHLLLDHFKTPHVKLTFPSQISEPFKITTCNFEDSGEVNSRVVDQLGLVDGLNLVAQRDRADENGAVTIREWYKVAGLNMAGVASENIVLERGNKNWIGVNFLLRYRVTLDFKDERLYAESTRFAAVRDRGSQDGFTWTTVGQTAVIDSVQPASIADKSGLRVGDAIKGVSGIEVKKQWAALRRLTIPSDQPLMIDIEREGKALKVELPGEPVAAAKTELAE